MQCFLIAVQKKDDKKFLTFISRSNGLKIFDTTTKKKSTQILTYAQLSRDFQEHGDWYFNFINGVKEGSSFKDAVDAVPEKTKNKWKNNKNNKFFHQ